MLSDEKSREKPSTGSEFGTVPRIFENFGPNILEPREARQMFEQANTDLVLQVRSTAADSLQPLRPHSGRYRNQSGPDGTRRRSRRRRGTFSGVHCETTPSDRDCRCFVATDGRSKNYRRGSGTRNRRRQRDCESFAARCRCRRGRGQDRRETDCQGEAGRSVRVGSRGTAERREVPICKGGSGIRATRHEDSPVHGRSRPRCSWPKPSEMPN